MILIQNKMIKYFLNLMMQILIKFKIGYLGEI